MKQRDWLAGVLCTLVLAPAAMAGDEPTPPPAVGKKVERRVIVRPGAEPEVMTWEEVGDGEGLPRKFAYVGAIGSGYLGVGLTELTPELRQHFGAPEQNGVLVGHVEEGSPAAKAGLQVGDVLTRINDEAVETSWDVTKAVRPKKEGETVSLEIVRGGHVQTLSAAVGARQRQPMDMMPMMFRTKTADGAPETFDVEALPEIAPAMKRLQVILDSPEMKERMEQARQRNEELEKKLEEMERRLQELEKKLKDSTK